MKSKYVVNIVVLVIGLLVLSGANLSVSAQKATQADQLIAEARALDHEFIQGFNLMHLDHIMSCYWNSPDLVAMQAKPTDSLYKRLGGYYAIAAVTDDFITRLAGDPDLGRFFIGHGTESNKRIRQMLVDQLCEATGGPCIYTGRDMKTVHAGLGITSRQWDTMVKLLTATLDKFKVPERERGELLQALSGLKKDIVEK